MWNSAGAATGFPVAASRARTIQMHCGGQTRAQIPQAVQRSFRRAVRFLGIDQEGDHPERLRDGELFLRVLDGEYSARVFAPPPGDALRREVTPAQPAQVLHVGLHEVPQGNSQTF